MRSSVRALLAALRRPRSAEVRTLALMFAVSSAATTVGALVPMTDQAPRTLNAGLSVLGLVLAAALWCSRTRLALHAGALVLTGGVATCVAAAGTPAGTAATAISFLWVPIYAAFFFGRRAARAYAVLVAAALAVALVLNPFVGAAHVWVLTVLTTCAAAEAVGRLVDRLHRLATSDPLTGLLNREGLRREGARALSTAQRTGAGLTVVAADLDGFKLVNDRDGHEAGDRLLVELADAWSAALRPGDLLARVGGDEFVLLLPGADEPAAHLVMSRVRAASPAAWSYGLAVHTGEATLSLLLREADRDLYAAKAQRAGRAPTVVLPGQRRTAALPST